MAMRPTLIQVLVCCESDRWNLETDRISDAVRRIANDYGYDSGEISVAVLDDAEIREVNAKHLGHDYETDVISFPFETEGRIDGEILVSFETATRCAVEHGWRSEDELLLYVIHGMLHLCGLGDLDPESAEEMRAEERHYLNVFGVPQAEQHGFPFEPH